MNDDNPQMSEAQGGRTRPAYRPPAIRHLGTLADLTQKQVGAADGQTFLGIDIGTV